MRNLQYRDLLKRVRDLPVTRQALGLLITLGIAILAVFWLFTAPDFPDKLGFDQKTLWDVLQLAGIPVAVFAAGVYFSWRQKQAELQAANAERENDRQIAANREENDRRIARDRDNEAALQTYYERISNLLLSNDLRNRKDDSTEACVARALTLATLRRLDPDRKGLLLRFLYESQTIGLIFQDGSSTIAPVIRLDGADLAGANLQNIDLYGANLQGVNLEGANLQDALLDRANLENAILRGTNLVNATLENAILCAVDFTQANLEGASLRRAHIREAILKNANLDWACLEEVSGLLFLDVKGATLTNLVYHGETVTWKELIELNKSDDDYEIILPRKRL